MTRTGRRPGAPDTREHIVEVARRAFGGRGYEATSLRSVAKEANVDPGLLVHYFGGKDGLFLAALEVTIEPERFFHGLEGLSTAVAAEQIVRRYLLMLDNAEIRDVVMSLVRSAVSNDEAAGMLREFLIQKMFTSLVPVIKQPDAQTRASLIVAQLIGVAMLKYIAKAEVVVQTSNDELVHLVAPAIERYLR
jgi:AcrR family transcriptional regulator